MPVITGIRVAGIDVEDKHGVVIQLQGFAPPGQARSPNPGMRKQFWEGGKRLPLGGLVALITKEPGKYATVTLALLTTCKFAG